MTDNEIIERYSKALGWKLIKNVMPFYWLLPSGERIFNDICILTDFSAFKQHVLEPMGEEGFEPNITSTTFYWMSKDIYNYKNYSQDIKDNEILRAAVIAATRYWEGRERRAN